MENVSGLIQGYYKVPFVLGVLGAILFLLGATFPSLNRTVPGKIKDFWTRIDSQSAVAASFSSVIRFVNLMDSVSGFTINIIRALPAVILICGLVPFSAYFLTEMFGNPEESFSVLMDVAMVSLASLLVILFIRFIGRGFADLRRALGLPRRIRYQKYQIGNYESEIAYLENRISEADAEEDTEFLERRIEIVKVRNDKAQEVLDGLSSAHEEMSDQIPNMAADAMGKVFIVFLLTIIATVLWIWRLSAPYGEILTAIFQVSMKEAWLIVIFTLPATFVLLILLQSLVPAFIMLLKPIKASQEIGFGRDGFLSQNNLFLFLLGVSLSVFMTFSAMFIGTVISPESSVPNTIQMVLSNAFFDGLTLAITILLLRWAVWETSASLEIPATLAVIALDFVVAALLAMASLYFGVLGTELEVAFDETFYVLKGLSIDGSHGEFGPYFWVMHTVFIPTCLYLILILSALMSKVLISITAVILRRSFTVIGNEMTLTGSYLMAMGTLIGGVMGLLGVTMMP